MNRIMTTILALLLSISAVYAQQSLSQVSPYNSLPIALSQADVDSPAVMLNTANILCGVLGMPENDECRAKALALFPLTPVTNCVGNAEHGVVAGSTWYISNNSGKNLLGDNIAQAQAKLDEAKLKKIGDSLWGMITRFGNEWFKEWGIVDATPPENI